MQVIAGSAGLVSKCMQHRKKTRCKGHINCWEGCSCFLPSWLYHYLAHILCEVLMFLFKVYQGNLKSVNDFESRFTRLSFIYLFFS